MPHFGIDNVEVSVRSTAPTIVPKDWREEITLAEREQPIERGSRIDFEIPFAGRTSVNALIGRRDVWFAHFGAANKSTGAVTLSYGTDSTIGDDRFQRDLTNGAA